MKPRHCYLTNHCSTRCTAAGSKQSLSLANSPSEDWRMFFEPPDTAHSFIVHPGTAKNSFIVLIVTMLYFNWSVSCLSLTTAGPASIRKQNTEKLWVIRGSGHICYIIFHSQRLFQSRAATAKVLSVRQKNFPKDERSKLDHPPRRWKLENVLQSCKWKVS